MIVWLPAAIGGFYKILMDDTSFDPRNWGKPPQPKNPAPTVKDGGGAGASTDLPEVWRSVAEGADHAGGPTASGPSKAKWISRRGVLGTSAVLLAGTGLAVWFTRTVPNPRDAAEPPAPAVTASAAATGGEVEERSLNLSNPAELRAALVSLGIVDGEAASAVHAAAAVLTSAAEIRARILVKRTGQTLELQRLQASYANGAGAVVTRNAAGQFSAVAVAAELTRQVKVLRGELDSESFYTSAVAAGLIDVLIPEFINAFGYDFNLASEVTPGNTFEVAYSQEVNADGDQVGQPELLYASLTTPTKSLALYRFREADGNVGWYDGNGASTRRGLMRTPVDGARITSKFGMRFHPVLHYNKMHGGTDFAAPIGTPIYAAADGVVEWAAMKGANGNLTIIKHDNGWETYYLHQSRFMPGVAPGARVIQGQHIGDIGTTGRSTGPHLHYEVHIDGQKVDPLGIKTDDAKRKRMEGAVLASFMRERDRIDVARAKQMF